MKPDNKAGGPWLYALGLIPVVWFALLIAPSLSGGLSEIVNALPAAMNHPFQIVWCEDSVKAVLIFIAAYGLGIGIYLSSRRNYRRGEEHGSAKWGDPRAVNKKYRDKDPFQNRIFTQHVRMGLDGKKHRRTLNSLVCGGSGAGKSRFYAKPNLLQASHVSYFVLDCQGELLRDCGGLLKATTPKGSQSNDPFWDTAASMLLMALVFYLHYEAPEDEKNFAMIMEMLRAGEVREDDDSYQSPLDELFERLEMRSPDHIAVKYYKDYRSGSAKTLKSIQITLAARLEKFNLSSVAALTATDELDLASLGEKKVALFALIPDNDSSFNFLVSLLYASTFQELFYSADRVHGGSLPVPVHFLMDEFANVSLPDDFDKLLATMRSRNISVSIIIQNIAQLKALYEKQWESIMGNCDEFLYLGGNETSTHKLISENYLGKSTLWLDTYGKSTGHSGSYSTNNQITGRELLTPDEVRMLDNNLALIFIRGEPPLMDEKYDLLKHPNVKYTTDGGAPVYTHGGTENAVADMAIGRLTPGDLAKIKEPETLCELLSDEDMEKIFQFKEEKQNETV